VLCDPSNLDATAAIRNVRFTSTAAVSYALEPLPRCRLAWIQPDASNEILRIENAIGNEAAQSSAMTQNARGPRAP
jgi:hypothetical protein